jgi:ATP-dependent DNA ligase
MPLKASVASRNIGFIETMDCLPVSKLPQGPHWTYEIKLDGYRIESVRAENCVTLYSRKRNVLNDRFGYIATSLEYLPAGTVIDGEVVGIGQTAALTSISFRNPELLNRALSITPSISSPTSTAT